MFVCGCLFRFGFLLEIHVVAINIPFLSKIAVHILLVAFLVMLDLLLLRFPRSYHHRSPTRPKSATVNPSRGRPPGLLPGAGTEESLAFSEVFLTAPFTMHFLGVGFAGSCWK